jgi:hypothetical protein
MLQSYLNATLLPVTDEGDFKKLKKSADDLAKRLLKNRHRILSFTLTALNSDVSVDDPDVKEVNEIIIKNWTTFSTNSKSTPLTFIRAVIFETLNNISADINIALIIWLSSRNIYRYAKFTGNEKIIVEKFLSKLASNINSEANLGWGLNSLDIRESVEITLQTVPAYMLNKAEFQKLLEDASGPTNSEDKTNYDSPNSSFPDEGAAWSYEFAPRAAAGIKKIVDRSLEVIVKNINENNIVVQNALKGGATKFQNDLVLQNRSLNLRSELLWWKEAGYSVAMDVGYHEVNNSVLDIVMAFDYSNFIPIIYPKSVDYFFRSTVKEIVSDGEDLVDLKQFFKGLIDNSTYLKSLFPEMSTESKIPLLNFIVGMIYNKYNVEELESRVGISTNIEVRRVDLALWLFHDLQLQKILSRK